MEKSVENGGYLFFKSCNLNIINIILVYFLLVWFSYLFVREVGKGSLDVV